MPKELIGMIVAFVSAWLAPHLGSLGLPESVASEWVATIAAGLFAVSATVQWVISKSPRIHGPAMIAVGLIEETMSNQPNDAKRTAAVEKLHFMIDAMDIGAIQKWLLKRAAPMVIESIVKQAKYLLMKPPPEEPPRAIPAS
ncbi:MAG: hypothetical protein KJ050_10585 [Candidatus Omnitrophica bacterium]|nr:hypothetical protein [Candidatus Omnitrophota bacterium]